MRVLGRNVGRHLALAFAVWAGLSCAAVAQEVSLVRVDEVRLEPLTQTVPVIGRLVARQIGDVATRIGGAVEAFHVEVGDRVSADQIIAELDTDLLNAQLALVEGELAQAEADLESEQATRQLAQQELDRYAGLQGTQAYSKARFDDAVQNVARAQAAISKAQAQIATRRAGLTLNRLNLEYARIRAPYDGVIIRRMVETGAYVRTGDALVHMMSDTNLEVEADVPSQRIVSLLPGTQVSVQLDDGSAHTATVRASLPVENPLTRTRAVRFVPEFAGEVERLADAQTVTVMVPVGAEREVLTVHKDAIIQRGGQSVVYVVVEDAAQLRTIELGDATGGRVEVLSGLEQGDKVVVRGNERLQPGARVQIDAGS